MTLPLETRLDVPNEEDLPPWDTTPYSPNEPEVLIREGEYLEKTFGKGTHLAIYLKSAAPWKYRICTDKFIFGCGKTYKEALEKAKKYLASLLVEDKQLFNPRENGHPIAATVEDLIKFLQNLATWYGILILRKTKK